MDSRVPPDSVEVIFCIVLKLFRSFFLFLHCTVIRLLMKLKCLQIKSIQKNSKNVYFCREIGKTVQEAQKENGGRKCFCRLSSIPFLVGSHRFKNKFLEK